MIAPLVPFTTTVYPPAAVPGSVGVFGVVGVLLLPPPQPNPTARNANSRKLSIVFVLRVQEGMASENIPAMKMAAMPREDPFHEAVEPEEIACGAVVDTVSVAVELAALGLRLSEVGLTEQVVSRLGGALQVSATVPENPMELLTVIVVVPDLPAEASAIVSGFDDTP